MPAVVFAPNGSPPQKLLKLVAKAATIGGAMIPPSASTATGPIYKAGAVLDVRNFGAVGDGNAIYSPAINRAIEAASGGGAVCFPTGLYLCYSLHLKSAVSLYLDHGSVIIAAETPREGTTSGYDHGGSNTPGRHSRASATITGTMA